MFYSIYRVQIFFRLTNNNFSKRGRIINSSRFETPADLISGDILKQDNSITMDEVFAGYGKITILHNISLEIPKGNIVAVIGNSGAGKSTAIRAITAQIQPKKGKIITAGYDVKETVLVQASIGYVPQLEYQSLYYNFSAEKNALFFGRNFGLSDKQIKKRCEELLGLLGLSEKEFKKVPVKRLSGGEKKRVSRKIC